MTLLPAFRALALTAIALPILGACADKPSPHPTPQPTSLEKADPCTYLPKSLMSRYGLKQTRKFHRATGSSCVWSSGRLSMLIIFRWDDQSLVDFSEAFPNLGEDDAKVGGISAMIGKSDAKPACSALVLAGSGKVVEIIVDDQPPSTADAACERVSILGGPALRTLREQKLLDTGSSPSQAPPS